MEENKNKLNPQYRLALTGTKTSSILADFDLGRMGTLQKPGSFVRELNTMQLMTVKVKANPGDSETLASPATASCLQVSYKKPVAPSCLPSPP